jgi:hypothetical protein
MCARPSTPAGDGSSSVTSTGTLSLSASTLQGGHALCRPGATPMGVKSVFGSTTADAARGLAVRMDHGPQYISVHFLNQLHFWGHHLELRLGRGPETIGGWPRRGSARVSSLHVDAARASNHLHLPLLLGPARAKRQRCRSAKLLREATALMSESGQLAMPRLDSRRLGKVRRPCVD